VVWATFGWPRAAVFVGPHLGGSSRSTVPRLASSSEEMTCQGPPLLVVFMKHWPVRVVLRLRCA
jgi:hypothetical protein